MTKRALSAHEILRMMHRHAMRPKVRDLYERAGLEGAVLVDPPYSALEVHTAAALEMYTLRDAGFTRDLRAAFEAHLRAAPVTEKLTPRARRRWRRRWNRARRRWPFRSLLSWDRATRYATTLDVLRVD